MKKETLKDWVKTMTVDDITGNLTSLGMGFQAGGIEAEEFERNREIYTAELKKRINPPRLT